MPPPRVQDPQSITSCCHGWAGVQKRYPSPQLFGFKRRYAASDHLKAHLLVAVVNDKLVEGLLLDECVAGRALTRLNLRVLWLAPAR